LIAPISTFRSVVTGSTWPEKYVTEVPENFRIAICSLRDLIGC
jgi:hypothetical protein